MDSTDLTRVRRAASTARKRLGEPERCAANAAICARLAHLIADLDLQRIGSYRAMGAEADPAAAIADPALQLYLPKVVAAEQPLRFVAVDTGTRFARSPLGVDEPLGEATVAASSLQLLLIPLLAFDRNGTRIGYGGGYYDRTLAECGAQSPLRVGVAFAVQEQARLPRRGWDEPLHFVATEKEIIECPKIPTRRATGC